MPEKKESRARWARLYSTGIEFGSAVIGATLLGVWIDHYYGTGPKATLILGLVGLVGGMYNFVRSSIRQFREQSREEQGREEQSREDSREEDRPSNNGESSG